ncbi:MAG: hypothetical protein JEY94_16480 [Melioribacteraceae bacterium]|nr:hypothetical protein [Melioribacteraceae bacterium]
MRRKNILFWILAILITVASAFYQKMTGPTYPVKGEIQLNSNTIQYKLYTSHGGDENHLVKISVPNKSIAGTLFWKRYKTNDEYIVVPMENIASELSAILPHQPPAGKLQYYVKLNDNGNEVSISAGEPIIIRFKGAVPTGILIIHVITIFGAMLLSTRTGFEALRKEKNLKKLTYWTMGFLIIGGLIFGPIVQKYAFGAYWTGFPYGTDLTDNKTLIAFIGWLFAFVAVIKSKQEKVWIIFAAILMFVIFIIPHSMMGSELDYNKLDKVKTKIESADNKTDSLTIQ